MQRPTLQGRSILIVEDEAIIAMDLTMALESAGAEVTSTGTLKHALLPGGARWAVSRYSGPWA